MTVETDYGSIIIHQIHTDLGNLWIWYQWRGGNRYRITTEDILYNNARDCWESAFSNQEMKIGPYKLKLIDQDGYSRAFEAVRMSSPWWRFVYWWYHATKWFHILEARFIMTLSLWWIADYHPSRIPSWDDVFIFKRMKGWFKKWNS